MTSYKDLTFEMLKELPYFTKEVVISVASKYDLSSHTIDSLIARGIKVEEIIALKRNLYVTRSFFDRNKSDISYVFMLANKLCPSYISMETALQYYGLYTEAVNIVYTSITNKSTREFSNRFGIFKYRSISGQLFNGFEIVKGNFEFTIASKPKAIFDYLYYRTDLLRNDFDDSIYESLRIDVDELTAEERKELDSLITKYKKF